VGEAVVAVASAVADTIHDRVGVQRQDSHAVRVDARADGGVVREGAARSPTARIII
jgi:hypothetical protein